MDIKKWIPWNWFKKEEENTGKTVPVHRKAAQELDYGMAAPWQQLHRELDRLFSQAFRNFGLTPSGFDRPEPRMGSGILKPTLDLSATDKDYAISLEIPGVDEKDVKLEIVNDTLTIRGEKKQEKEEKDKNYYRMERSYGSFQRVLSLPEDADQDGVSAVFKNQLEKLERRDHHVRNQSAADKRKTGGHLACRADERRAGLHTGGRYFRNRSTNHFACRYARRCSRRC